METYDCNKVALSPRSGAYPDQNPAPGIARRFGIVTKI
jgi:hypothetical protein